MPEHRDFVSKFKNHTVKLSFYPVLQQFRFIVEDMLESVAPEGLEDVVTWKAVPTIKDDAFYLSMQREDGTEIWQHQPLHIDIRCGDLNGSEVVPLIVADMEENIKKQCGQTLREFINNRADYRNQLLYASDGHTVSMHETLTELIGLFRINLRDLIWVLALLVGGKPISKEWGLVGQFIGAYREVLVKAKAIKGDGSVELPAEPA